MRHGVRAQKRKKLGVSISGHSPPGALQAQGGVLRRRVRRGRWKRLRSGSRGSWPRRCATGGVGGGGPGACTVRVRARVPPGASPQADDAAPLPCSPLFPHPRRARGRPGSRPRRRPLAGGRASSRRSRRASSTPMRGSAGSFACPTRVSRFSASQTSDSAVPVCLCMCVCVRTRARV